MRIGAIASATSPGKQNVPPFRGSTWNYSMPKRIGVNGSKGGETRKYPVSRKERTLQCLGDGTCGRTRADSCAGVTPYCSFFPVGYDISCGRIDPLSCGCSA